MKRIGPIAYQLALPADSRIHNVFHLGLLCKHLGPTPTFSLTFPPTADDDTIVPHPEKILERRVIQKGRYRPKMEILVKWRGAPVEDGTWENS